MSAVTIIFTIRHGHTQWNTEKRYAGTIDIPLSEKGIEDCRKAAEKLAGYHFDVVVTSEMNRSLNTARLLVSDRTPIVQSMLCNERRFGVMEGHTWEEIQTFVPPIMMIEVGGDLHTVNPQGGEPFEDVWDRAKRFRRFLFKQYRGKSILVVSHGVFLQMFHGLLRGVSCIESLAAYPANLELANFCFHGNRLMEAGVVQLNHKSDSHF